MHPLRNSDGLSLCSDIAALSACPLRKLYKPARDTEIMKKGVWDLMGEPVGVEQEIKGWWHDFYKTHILWWEEEVFSVENKSNSSFSEALELLCFCDLLDKIPSVWTDLNVFVSMHQDVNEYLLMPCDLYMSYWKCRPVVASDLHTIGIHTLKVNGSLFCRETVESFCLKSF